MRVEWENGEWIKRTPPEHTLMERIKESMRYHTGAWVIGVLISGAWFYLYGSQIAAKLFERFLWIH